MSGFLQIIIILILINSIVFVQNMNVSSNAIPKETANRIVMEEFAEYHQTLSYIAPILNQ